MNVTKTERFTDAENKLVVSRGEKGEGRGKTVEEN